MKMYKFFFTAFFFINVTISSAQPVTGSAENSKELFFKKDFSIFRDSLQQVHPALYRYRTKEKMNHLFDSCYASINSTITDMQFYLLLKFMVRMVDDGHLLCNLPRETLQQQLATAKVFPLRLYFIGNKAYVYCSADDRFKPGTEIISINNKPVDAIRKILFQYLSSDAEIQSARYAAFNAGEASFQFFYYWLYGEKDSFQLEYKNAANETASATVAAAIIKGAACFFDKKPVDSYLSFHIEPNHTALLTIKTFAMGKLNREESYFRVYLDSVFEIIKDKNITRLIIDVRDNGGGEDHNGSLLYSFLTDKPFRYYASLSTISGPLPTAVHSNLEIQLPQKNNFKGQCYFLINGKSFSTTSEFTAIAKSNKRGLFIGEETGGGYYGNTGSEQAIFTLPYSATRIIIPKRKYVLAVTKAKYKDRGTIPDFIIVPTISEVLGHKDVPLNYALRLATGNSNQQH